MSIDIHTCSTCGGPIVWHDCHFHCPACAAVRAAQAEAPMTAPDRAGDLCTCLRCQGEREAAAYPSLEAFMLRGPSSPGWAYACAICGNKRCPHHEDHRFVCTRSNEPGQIGQLIEARDAALANLGALDADLIVMAPDASAVTEEAVEAALAAWSNWIGTPECALPKKRMKSALLAAMPCMMAVKDAQVVTDEAVEAFARAYTGEDEWQLAYDNSAAAKADMRTGLTAALPHLTAAKDAEIDALGQANNALTAEIRRLKDAQRSYAWETQVEIELLKGDIAEIRAAKDAEIATLKAEVARLCEFIKPEAFLERAGRRHGVEAGFEFVMSSPMVPVIANHMAAMLEAHGAENYVEIGFTHDELGPLTLMVQRDNGQTPARLAAAKDAEIERLNALLEGRDVFIVGIGQWDALVASLPTERAALGDA